MYCNPGGLEGTDLGAPLVRRHEATVLSRAMSYASSLFGGRGKASGEVGPMLIFRMWNLNLRSESNSLSQMQFISARVIFGFQMDRSEVGTSCHVVAAAI